MVPMTFLRPSIGLLNQIPGALNVQEFLLSRGSLMAKIFMGPLSWLIPGRIFTDLLRCELLGRALIDLNQVSWRHLVEHRFLTYTYLVVLHARHPLVINCLPSLL